ncbi:DinB family protein [Aquimarina algicola]|uniref:DinB family protein n=2 Tax=Aquimarina algicola TaxID=2589995 RepID=A0A504JK98_9FLAO|nr:DinB family protein [Aquimarina algicola]
MESVFTVWETSRNLYLDYFDKYTLEQLNKIPNGFNNNLIWNIGHIIVAQQALIYKGSNLKGYISDELFELYKHGTKPTGLITESEMEALKILLISMIEKTKTDFYNGIFNTYNERMTGTGFYLSSLMDAFEFNNYHEGLHLGHMMSIRKFI